MAPVESKMLAYLKQRIEAGAQCVSRTEIMNAVVPGDHPEHRLLPAYRYGLDRLLRRRVINAVRGNDGETYYYLGNYPTLELVSTILGGIVGWKS